MTEVVHILSAFFILLGSISLVIGAVGMLRLPDLYCRLHAASLLETLGAGLLIVGLMLVAGLTLVTLKLAAILLLMLITAPVATHALAQAALHEKIEPLLADDRRGGSPDLAGET